MNYIRERFRDRLRNGVWRIFLRKVVFDATLDRGEGQIPDPMQIQNLAHINSSQKLYYKKI